MATWFITGCSTGLGRALAEAVLARGHNAVVTARDTAKLAELSEAYPDTALALPLDVTDPDQVVEAAQQAQSRFDGIDVLVNNAGYGYCAAVEEGEAADIQRLFATNFFGAVGTIEALLPNMRVRRTGAIVNISSIGARFSPVGFGYYSATKAALEGMSGSLRKELQPLGISVTVVEPGSFRTDFSDRSLVQPAKAIADYSETAGKRRKEIDSTHGTQPGDPAKAAQAIIAAVEDPNPPFMLLLGKDALGRYFEVEEAQRADVEKWRELTIGTDFDAP
ncbi:oxidoreductase [Rhodococcus marinonascens]|uniref:oxidoreductase n=1 Tax=Rhodococcus marinonascens TaxID=38311 RepID=UPI000932ABA6|nr:oxidoreductase [Rhodococcus marinonascens]